MLLAAQRLKPHFLGLTFGTTEVVPFPSCLSRLFRFCRLNVIPNFGRRRAKSPLKPTPGLNGTPSFLVAAARSRPGPPAKSL
jgi:hypothetical protein